MALTEQKLMSFLSDTFNSASCLDVNTPLFSTGALDSVAMLDLIAFVEEAAGIEIKAGDVTLENFDTLARIIYFTQGRS